MNVETWNSNYPSGTPVSVKLDDGTTWETTTRSLAWMLGDNTPVVLLDGRSGGYQLDRVTPR